MARRAEASLSLSLPSLPPSSFSISLYLYLSLLIFSLWEDYGITFYSLNTILNILLSMVSGHLHFFSTFVFVSLLFLRTVSSFSSQLTLVPPMSRSPGRGGSTFFIKHFDIVLVPLPFLSLFRPFLEASIVRRPIASPSVGTNLVDLRNFHAIMDSIPPQTIHMSIFSKKYESWQILMSACLLIMEQLTYLLLSLGITCLLASNPLSLSISLGVIDSFLK